MSPGATTAARPCRSPARVITRSIKSGEARLKRQANAARPSARKIRVLCGARRRAKRSHGDTIRSFLLQEDRRNPSLNEPSLRRQRKTLTASRKAALAQNGASHEGGG